MNIEDSECAVAKTQPLRKNLRDIARLCTHRVLAYFTRNEDIHEWLDNTEQQTNNLKFVSRCDDTSTECHVIGVTKSPDVLSHTFPGYIKKPAIIMGNLQSDGKKRNKKQCIGDTSTSVTFERVHTPGKRHAPPPPSHPPPQIHNSRQTTSTTTSLPLPPPPPPPPSSSSSVVPEIQHDDIKLQLEPQKQADVSVEVTSGRALQLPPEESLQSSPGDLSKPSSFAANECTIVPPLGELSVSTTGPPLLVTDSWRRANANLTVPLSDIPTPPSQESSSDSIFTDPDDIGMVTDIGDIVSRHNQTPTTTSSYKNKKLRESGISTKKNRQSYFTLTGHKKIELTPTNPIATLSPLNVTPCRRHSAFEHTPSESTVLRRVASFTLGNASRETPKYISWSNVSTPKLPSHLVEKFEGQHLVNLLTSGIPEHIRNQLSDGDLNKFTAAFYAQLQAVGVITSIGDKTPTKDTFSTEQVYYWSTPARPSKQSIEKRNGGNSYSTDYIRDLENDIATLRSEVERLQKLTEKLKYHNEEEDDDAGVIRSKASSPMPRNDEHCAVLDNKSGTSTESGRFTASSLDISPIPHHSSNDKLNEEPCSIPSILTPISEIDNAHDETKYKILPLPKNIFADQKIMASSKVLDHRIHDKQQIKNTTPEYKSAHENFSEVCNQVEIMADSRKKLVYDTEDCGNKTSLLKYSNDNQVDLIINNENNIFETTNSTAVTILQKVSTNSPSLPPPPAPPPPPPIPELLEPPNISVVNSSNIVKPSVPPPPPPPLPEINNVVLSPPPPPMPQINPPPPPPPMPSMNGPPPPPFMPNLSGPSPPPPPPPPPPISGFGGLPPPPPPMMGINGPPPPPMPGIVGAPGIPLPPPIQGGPAALPTPPPGGWNPPTRATMRKQPLAPEAPMKPLYWTRILIPANATPTIPATSPDAPPQVPLWMEIEEEKDVNIKEFIDLFSRQVTDRKPTIKKEESTKPSKIQPAKILDSKRSKTVGILEKSLRVDFSEVENAVYNLDTSIVSLEALRQIYEIMPTPKEMEEIAIHEREHPDIPLDRPELFLKQLSTIKNFNERIVCLMFQSEFHDAIYTVSTKLTNLRSTCEYLRNSQSLKGVMALILTLGNYMNGGNRMRGQADGFGLEILGKLKDVKSKVPGVTLLHYVVKAKLSQEENCNFDEMLPLPVPEPADIEAASTIDFEEIVKELDRLDKELAVCQKNCKIVTETFPEISVAFKEKMEAFLSRASNELMNERENLQETRAKFKTVMHFYQYIPKGTTIDKADPKDFFQLWISFCKDFKDIWKNEQQRLKKERMKTLRKKIEINRKVETTKVVPGGLKDRLRKFMDKDKR